MSQRFWTSSTGKRNRRSPQGLIPDPYAIIGAVPTLPFPNSIFTTLIPASPTLASNSTTLVSNLNTLISDYNLAINTTQYTPSRYVVHGNSVPGVTVHVNTDGRHPNGSPTPNGGTAPSGTFSCPIPIGALPCQRGDEAMIIWDVDNGVVYEMWQCGTLRDSSNPQYGGVTSQINGDGSWSCSTAETALTNGTFSGVFTPTGVFSQTAASQLSYAGGVITVADILGGSINHSLWMDVPNPGSFVAPALSYDGTTNSTSIPEGTRFFFPSSVSMPGSLPLFAQMVFTALQKYGAYVTDNAGAITLQCENEQPWMMYQGYYPVTSTWDGLPQQSVLAGLPWASLVVANPQSAASII